MGGEKNRIRGKKALGRKENEERKVPEREISESGDKGSHSYLSRHPPSQGPMLYIKGGA